VVFNDLDTIAYSALPKLRNPDVIFQDIQIGAGKTDATAISKAKMAEIELHMINGDDLFRRRQFENAFSEFKVARSLIYKLIYPSFDAGSYVLNRKDVALPFSAIIEKDLVTASARMTDAIRPSSPKFEPPLLVPSETMPNTLKAFTTAGFHESVGLEEMLQSINVQAISLLDDRKAESAVILLQDALSQVAASGVRVDPALPAATYLNLGAAHLQADNPGEAARAAEVSLKQFSELKDPIGKAQALHLSGISAQRLGDANRAKQLLEQASKALKSAKVGSSAATRTTTTTSIGDGLVTDTRSSTSTPTIPPVAVLAPPKFIVSRRIEELEPIAKMDVKAITFRIPGRADGWGKLSVIESSVRQQIAKPWTIGVPTGDKMVYINVEGGNEPGVDAITKNIYEARVVATQFRDLDFMIFDFSTITFYLTHLYAYVLPLKMGDCFNELGQYSKAEEYFLTASKYSYVNKKIEGTVLWIRLARNAVEWGDSFYKEEDLQNAKIQYSKLITEESVVPNNSFLYTTAALSIPADQSRNLIQNLSSRPLPDVNWEIAYYVLTANSRLQQILSNLDFYGLLLSPIHTFEYLQSVARSFSQQAIQAEREFINFKNHEELEEATRRDLETAKAMARAEAQGRWELYQAAIEDEQATQKAHQLAIKRRDDAITQRDQYASSSMAQIWGQAAATALSGGEDAYWSEISELADKLARGETIHGPGPKIAAAQILYAGRKSRDYELKKMQDTIDELTRAIGIAKDQLDAATRHKNAAEIAWQAAVQRASMAGAALDAFDQELFTPESWGRIANVIRDIARSYLFQAIRIAKLMERAYNFENDTELKIIKNDYGYNVGNPQSGQDTILLGGDGLLKDIDSFTYQAITTKTRKNSRLKDVISVATNFPAQFEAFKEKGLLSLETDLYEFDRLHPGFYGQRLEAVELQVVGLLPEGGLNGTLTAGGVTRYRKKDGSTGQRVHQIDTMALSNFALRNDIFLYSAETGVRGLFQGLGLGTTWQLHLPKRSNDYDFRRIFDVQLVLYYTAKFDPLLRTSVLTKPPRPGEMVLLRTFGLRYDFPDAWYGFYRSGSAEFQFDRFRLPMNQQNFKVKNAFFRVITRNGISNQDIEVSVSRPGSAGAATGVRTDSNGVISTPSLTAIIGINPLGTWRIEIISGSSLSDENGVLKFDRVYNIQFGLEYSFEYVPEEL
jgi:hypothetical protein